MYYPMQNTNKNRCVNMTQYIIMYSKNQLRSYGEQFDFNTQLII